MSDEDEADAAQGRARSAPRQGFETEDNGARGAVKPPGPVELVVSAGELVADLAKAGVSAAERAIRGAVSRLPCG